ncbi:carnitine O-acetyltransferase-like isoform X2 [Rhopilema esculentum]|uniref:carnitine O-acetyltransferase-like isoform X2 n=1 Tax=Rhopilema esculentum TaxID=499914 RepID=UPI0031DA1771|eukprot:gene10826-19641_t
MLARKVGESCLKVMSVSTNSSGLKMTNLAKHLPAIGKKYSTFKYEMSLPRLPVPPLQQTMDKYLLSVKPLLTEDEYACTREVVDDFRKPGGVGEALQDKLVSRANKMENWLAEWWDDVAYLGYENPVVVHSSPGISFPKIAFASKLDQLRYCAKAIRAVLGFKSLIDSEQLPVDMQGKDPVTMVQYNKLLSICRIPHPTTDFTITTPSYQSRHIIVMSNNQAFEMDVYKGEEPLSETELLGQLDAIDKMSNASSDYPSIGVLTTAERRIWGKTYRKLKRDPINRGSLDRIIKSIFVLCLDKSHGPPSNTPTVSEDPTLTNSVNQMLHGGGSSLNSCNRWFDKAFQLIVSEDGLVGCNYEHSSAEGPPIQTLCNHIIRSCTFEGGETIMPARTIIEPKRLQWKLSKEMEEKIEEAKESIDQLVDDVDMKGIKYMACGKNVPKANRMSPDAFIQIGLQLAYYRLHGQMAPTYESASTRKFRLGRTETIRVASLAAKEFCEAMTSGQSNEALKRELFMKAVAGHAKYTKEAINGQGVDRHLLGLKLICMESGMKIPEIFRDKAYNYSLHFKLSTSQVPSPHDTVLCFGPVVPDGYGVCYNPLEKQLNFAVAAFNSNPETNAGRFGESLKQSFDDIQKILLQPKL